MLSGPGADRPDDFVGQPARDVVRRWRPDGEDNVAEPGLDYPGDDLPDRSWIVGADDQPHRPHDAGGIIQLTKTGLHSLREAGRARDEVDREFLAPLGDALGRDFVRAPQILARAD
jgi:hypothetical protein